MATCDLQSQESEVLCCFKTCKQDPDRKIITAISRKVEVKAFEPKKKSDKMLVNWEQDGSARFHSLCWDSLVEATKGVNSLSATLSDYERSMIIEAKKTAEFHDSDAAITEEASHIASVLKSSSHCIAFTGAGISTAAGIGDFRGKDGKWTKRDRVKNFGPETSKVPNRITIIGGLRPTYTHEALAKLVEMGCLKFIISQNVDGLHRLSGVAKENISELHGNTFTEHCEDCGKVHELKQHYKLGSKDTTSPAVLEKCKRCKIPHRTGRKCKESGCNGYLKNTVINFGDYLDSDILETAERQATDSDAVLVLGSSLKVSPANDLVTLGKEPLRIMLCNRQTTPYDSDCRKKGKDGEKLGARVFCDCDKLMKKVMEKMLSPSDLQKWERGRETRMAEYDSKRTKA